MIKWSIYVEDIIPNYIHTQHWITKSIREICRDLKGEIDNCTILVEHSSSSI